MEALVGKGLKNDWLEMTLHWLKLKVLTEEGIAGAFVFTL